MINKILVVDDSRIARMQIKSIINDDNVSISEASSGKDALEKLRENYYHLVLLDLLMPEVDGFAVLKFIKENNINSKVIVVSADIQDSTREEISSLGAFGFINKPPHKDELTKLIKRALEEAES